MQGPSESGYHFLQDFRNCERYFKHKYVDNIEPMRIPNALIFGIAGHKGMEGYYQSSNLPIGKRINRAKEMFQQSLRENQHLYEYSDTYHEDLKRGLKAFEEYGLYYANERWFIKSIEDTVSAWLTDEAFLTGRIDLVTTLESGRLYIADHKFTGWSIKLFRRTLEASDQATAYKLLWDATHPDMPVYGVIFNIIRSYKGEVDFDRLPLVVTPQQVEEFRLDAAHDFDRMYQKLVAPEKARWPKNTDQCFKFNRACPFLDICKGMNMEMLIGTKYRYREVPLDEHET